MNVQLKEEHCASLLSPRSYINPLVLFSVVGVTRPSPPQRERKNKTRNLWVVYCSHAPEHLRYIIIRQILELTQCGAGEPGHCKGFTVRSNSASRNYMVCMVIQDKTTHGPNMAAYGKRIEARNVLLCNAISTFQMGAVYRVACVLT